MKTLKLKQLSVILMTVVMSVNLPMWASDITPSTTLTTYYKDINGKSTASDALQITLCNTISDGYVSTGYSSLQNSMYAASSNPTDFINGEDKTMEDIYSSKAYKNSDSGSSASNCGQGWNKEHTVPQSWFNEASPMKSDAFHVYPTDIRMNSLRSSYPYGETDAAKGCENYGYGSVGTSTFEGYSGTVFDPGEGGEHGSYKGDLARTYFYMVIRYRDVNFTSGTGGTSFTYNSSTKVAGLTDYMKNLMLKWHHQDPVSEKELKRNNAIYAHQKNRNPFIDYPELVEYIWGEKQGQTVTLSSLVSAYDGDVTPVDPPVFEPFDFILYCNGETQKITSTTATYTLPTSVANACDEWIFDGWSANKVEKTTSKPTYITTVKEATTVYAVYKNTVTSGEGNSVTNIVMETLAAASGTVGDFTFKGEKETGTNAPAYNTSGKDARYYAKNTLTISGEKEMKEIVFKLSTQGKKRLAPITASDGEIAAQAAGDTIVTWTGNATSVTFTVGEKADYGSDSGSAGQLCFTSVDITTGGGSTTITYASDAECSTVAPCEGQLATPNVTATAGDAQITLTWEEVTNADHYEVTLSEGIGFTTECSDPIIGEIIISGITNTCIITGLVNGLAYTTTVKAIGTTVCDSEADEDVTIPVAETPSTPTAIEEIEEPQTPFFVKEGTIHSEGILRIYDITGKEVTRMNGALSGGVYIIRTTEGAHKVLVR